MFARVIAVVMVGFLGFATLPNAYAEKYVQHVNGREFVVHTNPAPVVVHRVLPPFLGKHVTERQLKVGRLPPVARR
jgi:hypothetical protein